jgi:H+/Cl- antiporter ClcA
MSIEMIRMSKKSVTRLFVAALVAVVAGIVLGAAALLAALASDAIDVGGSEYIDVNGGSGAWTALGLLIVGSLAILGGTVAAVVSWIAALLNTWQLEDKAWFASLLALGLLGFGVVAMIAYVVAGPDGTKPPSRSSPFPQLREARPGSPG